MSESKTPQLSDRPATVGRILIYTYTGEEHEHMCGRAICSERPAIVVSENGGAGTYNVQVFTDCRNDVEGGGPGSDGTMWIPSVRIAAEPTPGYLHWPEVAPLVEVPGIDPPDALEVGDVVTVPGEGDLRITEVAKDGSMTAEPVAPKAPKAKKSKRRAG